MQGSINAFANTAAKYGGYFLYYPTSGNTNDIGQTYPLRYQKTTHFDATITSAAIARDQALLIYYLSNSASRNFYYNGHGSPNSIAGGVSASILKKAIKHRYRFVFLDGCETDWGNLDAAFGIHGPGLFDLDYYEKTGIRPAVFLGYAIETPYAVGGEVTHNGITYDDTIPDDIPFFITNFLFYWDLMGQTVLSSISKGSNNLNPVGGWYPGSGMGIFGYSGLKIDDFNHAGDTW